MTKVAANQVADTVQALKDAADQAVADQCPDRFGLFEAKLNQLDAACREIQQEQWQHEAQEAIDHLQAGSPLTEQDTEVIRTFLIADAEHYLAVENNFQDWVDEIRRLLDEMANTSDNLDRDSIGRFRGVLKDAIRLVPDIRNFLEERRRVEKFEAGLHTFDADSRQALAHLLAEQLRRNTR
ncbi:MAG: hypothetical protein ACE5GE_00175 [Phycisphaerae bacterium]